jgi:hypothetical protein
MTKCCTPPATVYLLREQNTAATARVDAKGMSQLTCQCQHNDCQNKGLKARRVRE